MSRNDYPSYTCNSIIKGLKNNTNTNRNKKKNNKKKILVKLPYLGYIGEKVKKHFKKVQKCRTEKVCFFTRYETKKNAYVLFKDYSHIRKGKCYLLFNMSWF